MYVLEQKMECTVTETTKMQKLRLEGTQEII